MGLKVGGMEALISLYIIFICRRCDVVLTKLLDLITIFGKLSEYTINWIKSDFTPLSDVYTQGFLECILFKMVKDHLTYLGLKIPKDIKLVLSLSQT